MVLLLIAQDSCAKIIEIAIATEVEFICAL